MKKLFIDTNVIIDLLAKRDQYEPAAKLFTLADADEIDVFASSLSFSHIHYILRKLLGNDQTIKVLRDLELIVAIKAVDGKVVKLALNDDSFKDFEDGLQYYCAIESGSDVIITRNLPDFKASKIPILTADQYLKSRHELKSDK